MAAEETGRVFLLLVTITWAGIGLAIGTTDPPSDCPCDCEIELSDVQMDQAEAGLDRIQSAYNPLSGIPRIQLPVVSLEEIQKNYVMEKFGVLFSNTPPLADDDQMSTPTRTFQRGKRDPIDFHFRACPPDGLSYRDLNLGVNASGSPVQIIQLNNQKQWLLEERCERNDSDLLSSIVCLEVNRSQTAVVINLENPGMGIHMEPIRVQTCATFLRFT